jgi:putative tricarboxylic transport membrane protein
MIIATGVLWDSRTYPASLSRGTPGPAFFPRLLAILLGVAGAVLLIKRYRTRAPRDKKSSVLPMHSSKKPANKWGNLGLTIVAIAGFLLVSPQIGTVLALPILVSSLMWLIGERSALLLVTVPLVFSVFVYGVFSVVLGVPLP